MKPGDERVTCESIFFFFFHCFDSRVKSRVSHLENFGLNFSNTSLVIILRNNPKLGNDRQILLQIVDSYNLSILPAQSITYACGIHCSLAIGI